MRNASNAAATRSVPFALPDVTVTLGVLTLLAIIAKVGAGAFVPFTAESWGARSRFRPSTISPISTGTPRGAPSFVTDKPGDEIKRDPARFEIFKDYVRNIACWLGVRSR